MIEPHRLIGRSLAFDDAAHQAHDFDRRFGIPDLSAEQSDPRAASFGLCDKFHRIARGARRTAENTDDEVPRVEGSEFLHHARPVINHFQKKRPFGRGNARKGAGDRIIHVKAEIDAARIDWKGGIENLEKMAHSDHFRLLAEGGIGFESSDVSVEVVLERDGVKAEIGDCAGVLEACRAEWPGWRGLIGAAAEVPDVCGVVQPHGWRDGSVRIGATCMQRFR